MANGLTHVNLTSLHVNNKPDIFAHQHNIRAPMSRAQFNRVGIDGQLLVFVKGLSSTLCFPKAEGFKTQGMVCVMEGSASHN